MHAVDSEVEALFWANVEKRGPDDCWRWLPAKHDKYYGHIRTSDKRMICSTHVSLALDGRPRPDSSLMALHSCDWPPCQNPAHLRWGTAKENSEDWLTRGRYRNREPIIPPPAEPVYNPWGWQDLRRLNPQEKAEQIALRRAVFGYSEGPSALPQTCAQS